MSHPIVHVELSADDLQAASQFYREIFDWEMQSFPDMNYVTFSWGAENAGGGFSPVREENPAGTVIVYVQTEDIGGTLDAVNERGGQTLLPPMDVPGVGQIAIFSDPTGNKVGLLQPGEAEG